MILHGFYQHHSGILIANYGDSWKVFDPRKVNVNLATHGTLSLLWESRASAQGFVFSPTKMADWTHPDGTPFNPEESGLPTPGKDELDSPVVTAVPNAIILPPDAPSSFHQRKVAQGITPEERQLFPQVADFMDAMQWMVIRNNGRPVESGGTFLDWTAIDKVPFEESGIKLAASPSSGVDGLTTTDGSVRDYHSFFSKWIEDPAPSATGLAPPPIPVAQNPSTATMGPTSNLGMDPGFAKEFLAALKGNNRTTTEQEALADREEAEFVIRLLFCRLVDNKTLPIPGTEHLGEVIALPELTKAFKAGVMVPHSNLQATKKLATLWEATDTEARQEGPFGRHLVTVHRARATLITEFFTAQVRTAQWSTKPMEQYLTQATQAISLLLFAPPHMTASQYEELMANGRKVQVLVTQGEDAKNQARKQTVFAPLVHLKRKEDLDETVASLWAFERMSVAQGAPEPSQLVTVLSRALTLLSLSSGATHWHQLNEECGHALVHIFMEFQAAFREFTAFATSPAALHAAKTCTGGIIADQEVVETLHNLQKVVLHAISLAATSMTRTMPPTWKEASPVAHYFATTSPPIKRTASSPVTPEKPNSAKKQRGSTEFGGQGIGSPLASTGTGGTSLSSSRLTLSPEELTTRKSKGLLIVTEGLSGRDIHLGVAVKPAKATQSRYICKGHTIRGMACQFAICKHFHLNSLQDLEPESAAKLRAFISSSETLDWANTRDATPQNKQG
jgi:hypothetical protein